MSLFKCKMCGGSLKIAVGATVVKCEYCGMQQTLSKLDDDKRANMYDRATTPFTVLTEPLQNNTKALLGGLLICGEPSPSPMGRVPHLCGGRGQPSKKCRCRQNIYEFCSRFCLIFCR